MVQNQKCQPSDRLLLLNKSDLSMTMAVIVYWAVPDALAHYIEQVFLYDQRIYDKRHQRPCCRDHGHIPLPGIFHSNMAAVEEKWGCRRCRWN